MIDVHCHVFHKNVLTLGGKMITQLGDVVTDFLDKGDYDSAETKIARVNAFIETSQKDAGEIAGLLYNAYGDGSAIVPLMYDMYYLTHDIKKDLGERLKGFLARLDGHDHKDAVRAAAIGDKVRHIGDGVLKDIADSALDHDCFAAQVADLQALKAKFDKRVYPFLSYDPRRKDNLKLIKENVGPGKAFHGVKLYAPLGFSAGGKALMDKEDGLYAYCVANDIPITAHCSCPGMPTMNDHLDVPQDSWVFVSDVELPDTGDGECSKFNTGKIMQTAEETTVDFTVGGAARKSLYFNHPDIWQAVLDAFPTLRLNLAHFGGDCADWRARIAKMIDSGNYPNLYTDVSCRTKRAELDAIRIAYEHSPKLQQRLMFGSDFTILLLSSDLSDFLAGVRGVFPADCKNVYEGNAKSFLNLS